MGSLYLHTVKRPIHTMTMQLDMPNSTISTTQESSVFVMEEMEQNETLYCIHGLNKVAILKNYNGLRELTVRGTMKPEKRFHNV